MSVTCYIAIPNGEKIEYVIIEKKAPQKLSLNIPAKYDPIDIQKK